MNAQGGERTGIAALARGVWDAVVVGAGPAGSTAAFVLARRGRRVLLVDRARFPRAKVCGGCLSARGVAALGAAGFGALECVKAGPRLLEAEIRFGDRRARVPLPGGAVIDRAELDAELAERARGEGAVFVDGTHAALGAVSPLGESVELSHLDERVTVDARVVIAADGLGGSSLRLTPGMGPRVDPRSRMGVGAIVMSGSAGPGEGVVQLNAHEHGYVGLARLSGGRMAIGAALDPSAIRECGGPGVLIGLILESCGARHSPPHLTPDLSGVHWHWTPGLTRERPLPGRGTLLIAGDAAAYVEPFTGEGMTWAIVDGMRQAEAAERTLATGSAVGAVRARVSTHACRAVAGILRRPRAARAALGAIAAFPSLGRLLARVMHGGVHA